jgi:hypothetical protein
LQTDDFKNAIVSPAIIRFFAPVVQHLSAPSSVPTLVPSVSVSERNVDITNVSLTVGMSAIAGVIFLGMCDMLCAYKSISILIVSLLVVAIICCCVICFAKKRDKKKRVAVYVTTDDE